MKDERPLTTSDLANARDQRDSEITDRERLDAVRHESERDRGNPLTRMVNRLRDTGDRDGNHHDEHIQDASIGGRVSEHVHHDDHVHHGSHVHHDDHVHNGDHIHEVGRPADASRSGVQMASQADTARPRQVDETPQPLFAEQDLAGYRTRWSTIQTGFVDEPRRAVEEADSLVAELMQRLAESFANERRGLEGQWERAANVSTEDLRIAMRRYRSFFERLLTI